jgi:hypothetical protein
MEKVIYDRSSPYFGTGLFGKFLDISEFPVIPKEADDVLFQVNKTYQYRPDLLASDLYGDVGLWWVFALRNPNTIQDPVFDMRIGNTIFLPKKATIVEIIG